MKKNSKSFLSILTLLLLILSLTGCKGKDKETDGNAVTTTPAVSGEPTTTAKPTPEVTDLTSIELAKLLGNGINLGNTMEAYGRKDLGTEAEVSSYETFWGQPITTQEIIDSMKAAGFDTLRVPVAWTNTMNFEEDDFTIRADHLDRVGEIIDYAIKADMYVVVNDHWDGGWWGMFGSATEATRDRAMNLYTSLWTQIAERYKDYSDKLIFESANEELGNRLNDKDSDFNADSGTLSEDECYALTNKINQTFVDIIRGTGGNNANRFLLIAGYNTDIVKTCDDRFTMPTDTAMNKLLVSVHYYTPWGYAGTASLSKWGSTKDYNEQNDLLAMMTKFTDKGYGVVIGEYMVALNADGTVKDNTCDFLNNFLNNCDKYGYTPLLWDCSSHFIRKDLGFFDKDVAELFKSRSFASQSSMTEEEIVTKASTAIDEALTASANFDDTAPVAAADDKAIAWIMFNSSDYNVMYSVGDIYDPGAKSDGLITKDVEITGPGTYTVELDFTGTGAGFANSTAFSAVGITNGETLYPGYIISIKDILINGESYTLKGKPYTTADNKICTRVNLYNSWVTTIPEEARTLDGKIDDLSATILDPADLGEMKTLTITFDYGPAE